MTQILLVLIVFSLVYYGLQRNHARHPHLYERLYGGVDVEDRDAARFRAEVRAARDHQDWPRFVPTPRAPLDETAGSRRSGLTSVNR